MKGIWPDDLDKIRDVKGKKGSGMGIIYAPQTQEEWRLKNISDLPTSLVYKLLCQKTGLSGHVSRIFRMFSKLVHLGAIAPCHYDILHISLMQMTFSKARFKHCSNPKALDPYCDMCRYASITKSADMTDSSR
jgi:hypothetical protein